jgi:hypothetical protein
MGAPRAWTAVSGQTTDGTERTIVGEEALRKVRFDPAFARIELDSTVAPPRVVVSAAPAAVDVVGLIVALTARVAVLEAKQFTTTSLKVADYVAVAWEHVLVSLSSGSISVTLPASSAPTAGARIRVSDVSPQSAEALTIACTFYAPVGGYYATSPYVVADDGGGVSLEGASIELLDTGAGWVIVSETCRPEPLV